MLQTLTTSHPQVEITFITLLTKRVNTQVTRQKYDKGYPFHKFETIKIFLLNKNS